ncbi:uncharacterized protein LOC105381787 [Plutella xylostella]|uniref:uncharacterized protein LOC105381787 n=1 Tax=Plutella xylostella TaxID=51655 RepID=UPI0020326C74|nr:uncharacterized protein LOC105381787 [Plutella xylostella]
MQRLSLLCVLVSCVGVVVVALTTSSPDDELDLSPSANVSNTCVTDLGRAGLCVKYSQCRDNGTIDKYGTIDENEIRAGNCPGRYDWCCEEEGGTETTFPQAVCQDAPGENGVCPWCVTLHKDGGSPGSRGRGGRYCAGVVVGDGGAMLTAASCLRATLKQQLWVSHEGRNYTVHTANTHKLYNSGSREHDLAVVVFKERLPNRTGACLSFTPPAGACRAVSFGKDGSWAASDITVSPGLCGARGGAAGAACGRTTDPQCAVAMGSPLLCRGQENAGWSVWGVSRGGGCRVGADTGAMYSTLAADEEWLKNLLPSLVNANNLPTPTIHTNVGETPTPKNGSDFGVIGDDDIRKTPS